MLLLNFSHKKQRFENDCLVACTEMALNHIGVQISYDRLTKLLKAGPLFTPFYHLRYLKSLNLSITLENYGDLLVFERFINLSLPVIVGVTTIG